MCNCYTICLIKYSLKVKSALAFLHHMLSFNFPALWLVYFNYGYNNYIMPGLYIQGSQGVTIVPRPLLLCAWIGVVACRGTNPSMKPMNPWCSAATGGKWRASNPQHAAPATILCLSFCFLCPLLVSPSHSFVGFPPPTSRWPGWKAGKESVNVSFTGPLLVLMKLNKEWRWQEGGPLWDHNKVSQDCQGGPSWSIAPEPWRF